MTDATRFERLLRRERAIVATGLLALVLLAWAYLLAGAGMSVSLSDAARLTLFPHQAAAAPMAGMDMPGMAMDAPADWGLGDWALNIGMWAAMMVAMMTPSAAPAILLYGRVRAQAQAARSDTGVTSSAIFAAGYLVLWLGFSGLAAAIHWGLERSSLLSPADMGSQSRWLSAAVLLGAGVYQLTPAKRVCLSRCRSPAQFLSRHWRPGWPGAVRLGLIHGAYCIGCCWILMGLLFVGGIMNLAWIAGITLLVAAEKLLPMGPWVARASGAGLIVWGLATLVV